MSRCVCLIRLRARDYVYIGGYIDKGMLAHILDHTIFPGIEARVGAEVEVQLCLKPIHESGCLDLMRATCECRHTRSITEWVVAGT